MRKDAERCGKMRKDAERCGKMRKDAERCGKMWNESGKALRGEAPYSLFISCASFVANFSLASLGLA